MYGGGGMCSKAGRHRGCWQIWAVWTSSADTRGGAKTKALTHLFFFIDVFCRFFFPGFLRLVTREFQKHDLKKKIIGLITKNVGDFSSVVLLDYFLSRCLAFRNKGSSKTRFKKNAENCPQPPKKTPTPLRHFPFPPTSTLGRYDRPVPLAITQLEYILYGYL
jgi:hypothetical protein